jgi:hypothetical protein
MSVTSKPMGGGEAGRAGIDWPIVFGKIGGWMLLISAGGLFFAVNGGFSVIGLGVIAQMFNEAGLLLWAAVSAITVPVPVEVAGLPTTQPLIPWIFVIGSSFLQVSVIWLKLSGGRKIPGWLVGLAALASLYDFGSTFLGFGTVAWIARFGYILQAPLALVFTFGVEIAAGFLLRRK